MVNSNLLKSKMIAVGDENFVTVLTDVLDCSRTTASKKLTGDAQFSLEDIAILSKRYGLSAEDIKDIFIGGD